MLINVGSSFAASYYFGPVIICQGSLRNKKLKRTLFIQNINVVFQYAILFKSLGSVIFLFLKKVILLFRRDALNG